MPASGLKSAGKPRHWVPSLYLAEGLPNAIVVTVSVVLLKNMGVDNGRVALYTSLLYLPWAVKPFWAPFVDIFSSKRRWITSMQLCLCIGLAMVALTLPASWWLSAVMAAFWGVAFCSATHDIAADGFYMLGLDEKQQAFFVGIRSTFYRLANMLASGGLVWIAGRMIDHGVEITLAWQIIFSSTALFFLLCALWHKFKLPVPEADVANRTKTIGDIFADFGRTFRTFFLKKGVVVAIAFMMLYRLPEALLGKMVQPFLIDPVTEGGLGLTNTQVGLANGIYGVAGIVLGGIVGGIYIAKAGLKKSLWPMALMLTLPSALYCFLAHFQTSSMWLICPGIAFEQFGYGFGFTAYMVYMMKFCENSPYTTSHYAFCTGFMALGLMLPGLFAGIIQESIGYMSFFVAVMALCPVTFVVTELVRRRL